MKILNKIDLDRIKMPWLGVTRRFCIFSKVISWWNSKAKDKQVAPILFSKRGSKSLLRKGSKDLKKNIGNWCFFLVWSKAQVEKSFNYKINRAYFEALFLSFKNWKNGSYLSTASDASAWTELACCSAAISSFLP